MPVCCAVPTVCFCFVDLRCGANAGKEYNASGHFVTGNTTAADGESSCHTNTL